MSIEPPKELQQPERKESLPKRRRPPLVGYVIAGQLGWILLVVAAAFVATDFPDVLMTRQRRLVVLAVGFLLGGTMYHLLWGKRVRFGLKGLFAVVFLVAALCGLALNWEYLPGTLFFDQNGFPHGTGWRSYYYDSGELMLEEHYRAGVTTRSTWYKPNGEVIATTIWKKDQVNVGYFLYQDGSIRTRVEARYDPELRLYAGAEDGDRIDYASDGSVEREFRDGKEVTRGVPGVIEPRAIPTRKREKEH